MCEFTSKELLRAFAALAQQLYKIMILMKGIELQMTTSLLANQGLQAVADYLGVGVDVAAQWSSTSIVLAQIKQRLEVLEKDVNTLLHSELESANKRFKDAKV